MTSASDSTGPVNEAFEVTLDEADLVQAFRLNARRAAIRPLALAAILVTVLLLLLLAISPAARLSFTTRPLMLMLEGALTLAAVLLLLIVLARSAPREPSPRDRKGRSAPAIVNRYRSLPFLRDSARAAS